MKTRLLYLLFVLVIPFTMNAQRQGRQFSETIEKYKAEKVAFLSDKLDLTIQEAEKFWPVYNEFQDKIDKLRHQGRPSFRRPDPDSLSTKEMEKLMDTKFQNDLKMAKLAQNYHIQYKEILPVKKVFILYQAEQEFMGNMLRKMRGQHNSDQKKREKPSNRDDQ